MVVNTVISGDVDDRNVVIALTKVEGAKTNTPSRSNTYKCLPIANTLQP